MLYKGPVCLMLNSCSAIAEAVRGEDHSSAETVYFREQTKSTEIHTKFQRDNKKGKGKRTEKAFPI